MLEHAGSVFALANGHIGLRGNLDEGEPPGLPGTYLNGFYEQRTLPYAEAGYGYPEAGQTVVNVTNGKVIRLLVDDEPFDVRFGDLRSHERTLDFRAGVLRREAEWCSPVGKRVRVSSVRLVSLVQRAVAYEVEPLDAPARLVVQSELVANEPMPPGALDPRAAAELGAALRSDQFYDHDARVVLVHVTSAGSLRADTAPYHPLDPNDPYLTRTELAMPIALREAEILWEGPLASGTGTLSSGSGALGQLAVTWASRTERPDGKTSPEELIAAAHASCFAMALALVLGENHTPPERLALNATCTLDEVDGAPRITSVALNVRAHVPGLEPADFAQRVAQAAEICPVSNALRGNVEISVRSELDQ